MKNKKIISILLSGVLSITSISPILAYADEVANINIDIVSTDEVISDSSQILEPVNESDYKDLSNDSITKLRGTKTKVIKESIKVLKANKSKFVKLVKEWGGKEAGDIAEKYYTKIVSSLDPLLAWTDIAVQAVEDAVYRGLWNAGVKSSTAKSVAYWISQIISYGVL